MALTRKTALWVLLALGLAWVVGGWIVKREGPAFAKWKLKRQIQRLEPWTASTNYSDAGWKRLVATARAFQKARPEIAQGALEQFLEQAAGDPAQSALAKGKVFLLTRMVFDLPQHKDAGGQADATGSARAGTNADGLLNTAWPLAFEQGAPRLVAGWDAKILENKSLVDEYVSLRYRFRYRNLSSVMVGH